MTNLSKPRCVRRSPTLKALAAALLVLGPHTTVSSADQAIEVAVAALVKVKCKISNRQNLVSSGFVWPDNGHIVTALHGVVGCTGRLVIESDKTADVRFGKVVKSSHEGDLAWVQLVDRDGKPRPLPREVKALQVTEQEPVGIVLDRYRISSYPKGGERADDPVFFRGGRQMVFPLGKAFKNDKTIEDLIASQSFPKSQTQILRVGTTLTHGQSGAAIVDEQGKLVAIVDGGLGGGWLMMNWGVDARTYMPKLRQSRDKLPQGISEIARRYLVSAILPSEAKAVPQEGFGLKHVRRLPLRYLYELINRRPDEGLNHFALDGIEFIKKEVSAEAFDALAFDIYEDPLTGATVGVPSEVNLTWNPQTGALEAKSGEQLRMLVGVSRYSSYEEARVAGLKDFVGKIEGLATWNTHPATLELSRADELEWANGAGFFDGTRGNTKVDTNLSMSVSGNVVLGYSLYSSDVEKLSAPQFVMYMMMQTAVLELANFASR